MNHSLCLSKHDCRHRNLSLEMLQQAENKITRLMGSTVNIRKGNAKDFRTDLGKWYAQLRHRTTSDVLIG